MGYLPIKVVAKMLGRSEPSCYRLLERLPHVFEEELFSKPTTLVRIGNEYVSIQKASEELCFSPEVIRRMIKRGVLASRTGTTTFKRTVAKIEESSLLRYVNGSRTQGFLSIPEFCSRYKTCKRTANSIMKNNDVKRIRERVNGKTVWVYEEFKMSEALSKRRCMRGHMKSLKFNDSHKLPQWHLVNKRRCDGGGAR